MFLHLIFYAKIASETGHFDIAEISFIDHLSLTDQMHLVGVTMQQAMSVFVKAGRADLADGMGAHLKAQAQGLLDVAAEKTNMGDFKGAVQTLLAALQDRDDYDTRLRDLDEVVAAYPISPQTHIVETLSRLVKSGELPGCEYVNVESEFAAMSVAIATTSACSHSPTWPRSFSMFRTVPGV